MLTHTRTHKQTKQVSKRLYFLSTIILRVGKHLQHTQGARYTEKEIVAKHESLSIFHLLKSFNHINIQTNSQETEQRKNNKNGNKGIIGTY